MDNKIVLIILAILLPPLAVFLKQGAGKGLIINIILCFLFWIPAVIHAILVVM
ncbi:YqaE/Pmp3 family membrane protein [Coraliomargarita parva]|uniref:YqaE/Pmp3 family membrane protein n=1 Tax=Coraliomargarita parva TaxID=3014050 RepID=UPI0022B424ED|nr:YqaE/Pmp3 family membrane protein [Coraliomargarita parva]